MTRREAYKIVLEDMMGGDASSLFKGDFDAVNGSKDFMYGICTVMENLAFYAGKDEYMKYSQIWSEHFQKSLDKAREL